MPIRVLPARERGREMKRCVGMEEMGVMEKRLDASAAPSAVTAFELRGRPTMPLNGSFSIKSAAAMKVVSNNSGRLR